MFEIFQTQVQPSIADKITVGGVPFDLTPASGVRFSMRRPWDSVLTVNQQPAVVVDAVSGSVRYDWQTGDTAASGDYLYWWTVELPGGNQDTPEGALKVLAHSPSTDLIVVDDVLLAGQVPAALQPDPSPLIDLYIGLASNRIMSEYGHFRPYEVGATKRFTVRKHRVRLIPYFLQSASHVVLSPESFSLVLDPTVPDYFLDPFVTVEGCYTGMRTSPWIPHVSPTSMRFGTPLIDVTGDWGYQVVPDAVRMGTLVTVRSWMLRDAATYSTVVQMTDPSVLPRPSGTYAIPLAAREHLSLFSETSGVT
jgi:hypothetical protein